MPSQPETRVFSVVAWRIRQGGQVKCWKYYIYGVPLVWMPLEEVATVARMEQRGLQLEPEALARGAGVGGSFTRVRMAASAG